MTAIGWLIWTLSIPWRVVAIVLNVLDRPIYNLIFRGEFSMRYAIALILLLPTVTFAGGHCRTFRSFNVNHAQAYYSVQAQKSVPFVYSGDIDSILRQDLEIKRLEQGLATNQLTHEQKMMQIQQSTYALRALSQQQLRSQALKHCDDTPAPAAELPPGDPAPAVPAAGDAKVSQIFAAKCASCHGPSPVDNEFTLMVNGQITLDARAKGYCIVGHVATGDMPRKAPQLSDAEIQTIAAWAAGQ